MSEKYSERLSGDGRLSAAELFSPRGVFTTKHLAIMAMLLAIRAILSLPFLTIYVAGGAVKLITLAYLCDAITAMLYGPLAALGFGFAGDTLGYFMSMGSGGAYLPVFAISEMATGLIFAVFFYKRDVNIARVISAWALNLVLVVLGLNSLWLMLLYGTSAGTVFTFLRVGVNLVQLPVHIMLTYFVLKTIRKMSSLK